MKTRFLTLLCFILSTTLLHAQDYEWEKGISYRPERNDPYTKQMCLLDVYYPKGKTNAPTVVWFHGGGLTGGKREIPNELREQGIILIGVEYRLCAKDKDKKDAINANVTTDDAVDDAAAAVAWVVKNVAKYGGSTDKIYLAGHSAGGYLVSMIGLDKTRLAKYGVDADSMAALIPFSGQMITHFKNRHDRGISDLQPIIDQYAPLYYVRKDCPPIILITGDRELEMLGRYEENAYMWRMLKLAGHPDVTLYELDGFNHGGMKHPAEFLLLKYIRKREQGKQ